LIIKPMKYDIITFGSATKDIFLFLEKGSYEIKNGASSWQKKICFPFGSKIFIERLESASGGGGTNAACTFAKQGLKAAYCGKVGKDKNGEEITRELKKFKVDTTLIKRERKQLTASSFVLSFPEKERTIFIKTGACHFWEEKDIPWNKIKKAKWFYLAPLNGEAARLFHPLVEFAYAHKIKVAANPGEDQLELIRTGQEEILKKIEILILNLEEAAWLTGIGADKPFEIAEKIIGLGSKIAVVTKGKNGSLVFDGEYFYEAGIPQTAVVEKTGAGDAFASGFVCGIFRKKDIAYGIQLGTANASSCLMQMGAKRGLLEKGEISDFLKVEVVKTKVSSGSSCR